MAYISDASGQYEVYVRPHPGPEGSGRFPQRSAGKRSGGGTATTGWRLLCASSQNSRRRRQDSCSNDRTSDVGGTSFDVKPDAHRFLLLEPAVQETAPVTHLNLVLNWFEEVKRRSPRPAIALKGAWRTSGAGSRNGAVSAFASVKCRDIPRFPREFRRSS